MFRHRPALKTLLIAPYLLLLVCTAAVIGALSFRAGSGAVDNLSGQLLTETVNRIGQAVERHVSGSAAVLEAAFPKGTVAPVRWPADLADLRTRFWLATSVHRDPNNYAYYGDQDGRFFGLWRHSEREAELRLRTTGAGPRTIQRFTDIGGEPGPPAAETRIFDPRERPWFRAARDSVRPTWTSIYIDFKTSELVATRTRRVVDAQGEFAGVVATDLSLQGVSAFLKRLALSPNGVAIVVERDGQLIGVSRGPHLRVVDGKNQRLKASDSEDALVRATYSEVVKFSADAVLNEPRTAVFRGPAGERVQVGYSQLRDEAGLDWLIMVAVPRHDFLKDVENSFRQAAWLGLLAALGVAAIGLVVQGTVARELRKLSQAVRQVADGDLGNPLSSDRQDELGALARSFGEMQRRLLTDTLTGLANREAVVRRIEERLLQQRRRGDARPFALIFVDLNDFKRVNDRFGHEVGDAVLCEVGERLRRAVRAEDLVARFAGDEFVVLLDSVANRSDASAARLHLESALREPLVSLAERGTPQSLGGACGLAVCPEDGQDVQTLLKAADADMYRRKPAT